MHRGGALVLFHGERDIKRFRICAGRCPFSAHRGSSPAAPVSARAVPAAGTWRDQAFETVPAHTGFQRRCFFPWQSRRAFRSGACIFRRRFPARFGYVPVSLFPLFCADPRSLPGKAVVESCVPVGSKCDIQQNFRLRFFPAEFRFSSHRRQKQTVRIPRSIAEPQKDARRKFGSFFCFSDISGGVPWPMTCAFRFRK